VATGRADVPALRSGLRERKKKATRDALTLAALRLALERGLENVRVEDIADEVGVSTRTFNNYFSSKYEAIAARHVDRVRQAAEALRARPADEPLWVAIEHAVLAPLSDAGRAHRVPEPEELGGLQLLMGALMWKARVEDDGGFAAAVAERTATDTARDMYPRLVAAAVAAATQVATAQWVRADPPTPLVPLIQDALRQLAAGLPEEDTHR